MAIGTVIGTLSATDAAGDALTYALVDENGAAFVDNLFEIVGNQVRVKAALDHEAVAMRDVYVKVSDGTLDLVEKFTIAINDQNEAPADVMLDGGSVQELSAIGTVVGTLSTQDPDAGETFTYTLLDNAGGRFAISGDKILVSDALKLDYEQASVPPGDGAGH